MECRLCDREECDGHECVCTGEIESCTNCQKIARTEPNSWQAKAARQMRSSSRRTGAK